MPRWYGWIGVHIFERLVNRFMLQTTPLLPEDPFILHKQIVPVTQIDELLKTLNIASKDCNLFDGDDHVTAFQVPIGKRWKLYSWWQSASTGDSAREFANADETIRFAPEAAVATAKFDWLTGFPMDEGWRLQASKSANAADTARPVTITYTEEDAY